MFVTAVPGAVAAQNVVLPSREELTPAERTAPPQQPGAVGVVGRLNAGPCPFEASNLTFTLHDVEFRGLTAVPAERLAPAWVGARGRAVSVAEICRIRDRASEMLLDEGILARVEIPPQEISGGRVRLEVVEARIAAVHVSGPAGPVLRKVEDYMSRLEGMAPFSMDAVQRQVLLASDIPGIRISTSIRPSDAGPGAVELEVQVGRDPVEFVGAVQNYGADEVGPWSLLARADLNSFTALGERTSLIFSTTSDFEEQQVLQLIEEVRLGGSGLLARGSLAFAESRPGGALEPLEIESRSFVGLLEAAYPFIRHRRRNLWLSAGVEFVDQTTDVFGGADRLTDDTLRVLSARIDGDQRSSLFGNVPAFASGGIEVRRGLSAFGASNRGETALSRTAANPQAFVIRADGRTETALLPRLTFATAALLQWADDPLLAYEEQAIGNFTIGRGYDPGAVSGDRAAASALELRYGPFQIGTTQAGAFGFFDSAWVENLDPGAGSGVRTVNSLGGGVRVGLNQRLSLDITYAHPLDAPFGGQPKPGDRLLVNLITRFR